MKFQKLGLVYYQNYLVTPLYDGSVAPIMHEIFREVVQTGNLAFTNTLSNKIHPTDSSRETAVTKVLTKYVQVGSFENSAFLIQNNQISENKKGILFYTLIKRALKITDISKSLSAVDIIAKNQSGNAELRRSIKSKNKLVDKLQKDCLKNPHLEKCNKTMSELMSFKNGVTIKQVKDLANRYFEEKKSGFSFFNFQNKQYEDSMENIRRNFNRG